MPGHDPERATRRREHRRVHGEVGFGLVAPVADGDTVGDATEELGPRADDVSPHQQLAAFELRQRPYLRDPREIVVDLIGVQLPRFVEPDVDSPAREVGEQLGQPRTHELERLRIARVECRRGAMLAELDEAIGSEREMAVTLMAQPPFGVPETVLVGHQLDVTLTAVAIEVADLVGRQGARVAPDLLVVAERECVLGVELDLVDLPAREPVDERLQRFVGRHLVAGDVEHHRADRRGRRVVDGADRELSVVNPRRVGRASRGRTPLRRRRPR